jgi:DNA mismatch repair protein MutS
MSKSLTPAQQQWYDLKQTCKDCLLLFRLWDFYELFYEDAHIGHQVLWLTLTAKNKQSDNPIPMAWIPYHALEKYLPRLVEAWYKVALAEQVWDVVPWSVVQREIVEIITPWTYIQENVWEQLILSCRFWWESAQPYYCAWWDFTLWNYFVQSVDTLDNLYALIEKLSPKEVVIHNSFPEITELSALLEKQMLSYSIHDHPQDMEHFLQSILWVQTLDSFWLSWWSLHVVTTLFSYIQHYQKKSHYNIRSIKKIGYTNTVVLDAVTSKNLEIFRSSYEWTEKYSLFWVLNRTKTSLWKRLLHTWLQFPSRDPQTILYRHWLIEQCAQLPYLQQLSWLLQWITDIPRIISKLYYKKPSPHTVWLLYKQLQYIYSADYLVEWVTLCGVDAETLRSLQELKQFLQWAVYDDLEQQQYWFIAPWFSTEVDNLRAIAYHSDDLLQTYLQELQHTVQANTLKIKRIKNQWYFLEVSVKDADILVEHFDEHNEKYDFIRSQSLKSAVRFITTYLSSLQEKILDAREALSRLEYQLLDQIIERTLSYSRLFDTLSESLALLDCSVCFAFRLLEWRKIPTLSENRTLNILWWRHPVVESFLPNDEHFISNDFCTDSDKFFHCITWPNMWWKSTYLRQNALLLLMAHAWLPVPVDVMSYYLLDGIYARVWSGDIIAKNQSTFMTEMVEVAYILRHATEDSFIVLDELGRWTSTYDWVALAQAISVYICHNIKAATLFATHYHEIINLEAVLSGFYNASVSVYESWNSVVFLKKIVQWWASKSYWIDVAKLAWLPESIITLAQQYLWDLESDWSVAFSDWFDKPTQMWFDFWVIDDSQTKKVNDLHDLLDWVNIDDMTPLESMLLLQKILLIFK